MEPYYFMVPDYVFKISSGSNSNFRVQFERMLDSFHRSTAEFKDAAEIGMERARRLAQLIEPAAERALPRAQLPARAVAAHIKQPPGRFAFYQGNGW